MNLKEDYSLKLDSAELGKCEDPAISLWSPEVVILFRRRCVAASKNDKGGDEVMQLRTGCAERLYSEKEKTPLINGIQ